MQIWQSPAWPNFTHDPARTESLLAAFSGRLGAIRGLHAALSAGERRDTFLRAITQEAVASFAIEGATLPPSAIEASVVASLAHRQAEPQRRTRPHAPVRRLPGTHHFRGVSAIWREPVRSMP